MDSGEDTFEGFSMRDCGLEAVGGRDKQLAPCSYRQCEALCKKDVGSHQNARTDAEEREYCKWKRAKGSERFEEGWWRETQLFLKMLFTSGS